MMKTDGEIQHHLEVDQFGKQCQHVSFDSPLQVWLACGFAFMPQRQQGLCAKQMLAQSHQDGADVGQCKPSAY